MKIMNKKIYDIEVIISVKTIIFLHTSSNLFILNLVNISASLSLFFLTNILYNTSTYALNDVSILELKHFGVGVLSWKTRAYLVLYNKKHKIYNKRGLERRHLAKGGCS